MKAAFFSNCSVAFAFSLINLCLILQTNLATCNFFSIILCFFFCFFSPPNKNQFAALGVPKKETSQIEGPSLNNTYGFKVSVENLQEAKSLHEVTYCFVL